MGINVDRTNITYKHGKDLVIMCSLELASQAAMKILSTLIYTVGLQNFMQEFTTLHIWYLML